MSSERVVASAAMTRPVLWHFPISHFNEKVRWALDWKGIPHVRKALGADYLPRALWATGQPRLPILFLDGRAITDSTRIIAALEERHPAAPLYPTDAELRRRALALEDFLDEELGHAIRTALVGPAFKRDPLAVIGVLSTGMPSFTRPLMRSAVPLFRAYYRARHGINDATIAASRGAIAAALDRLARERGDAEYLVGDRFTVADLTAAALLALLTMPEALEYAPAEPWPPEMAEYRASLADHPTVRWVKDVFRRHRGRSAEVAA